MSVIVIGLPAVEAPQLPPLRSVDPKQMFCLHKSPLVLPVEGAPLVYSADIAHDFVLHVQGKSEARSIFPRGQTLQVAALCRYSRGGGSNARS